MLEIQLDTANHCTYCSKNEEERRMYSTTHSRYSKLQIVNANALLHWKPQSVGPPRAILYNISAYFYLFKKSLTRGKTSLHSLEVVIISASSSSSLLQTASQLLRMLWGRNAKETLLWGDTIRVKNIYLLLVLSLIYQILCH